MEYDNTNTGVLFKNEQKQTDKHPDYKGSINIDGEEFWLSAWIKTAKTGNKFMSLSVKLKDTRKPKVEHAEPQRDPFIDDPDLPF